VARDPVCGMNVKEDKNNNLRSEFKGQNYYFCSDKCQKEFDRNPANFTRDRENRDQNQNQNQNLNQNNKDNRNRNDNRNDNRDDRRPR